jgi:hypothetical protein
MPENQMSAPIELAEGYDPFSEDVYVPQAQPQVEEAPTVNNEEAQPAVQAEPSTEQQVNRKFSKHKSNKPLIRINLLEKDLVLKV